MRTAWLIAGALVTVLTLVVTTVGLSRGIAMAQAPSEHTARTIPLPGNAQLRIEANGGHIRLAVHAGEAGVIVVDRQLEWTRDKPSVSEDWNGRTLRLDSSCAPEWQQEETCEVDYRLFVPRETDIEVISSTAPVGVDGVYGDVRVTSVSGDVYAYDIPGPLHVRSGSGDVRGTTSCGPGPTWRWAPGGWRWISGSRRPGCGRWSRTSGDIDLNLPEARYDVSVMAPDASVSTDRSATSPRKITASTPQGEVDICC